MLASLADATALHFAAERAVTRTFGANTNACGSDGVRTRMCVSACACVSA